MRWAGSNHQARRCWPCWLFPLLSHNIYTLQKHVQYYIAEVPSLWPCRRAVLVLQTSMEQLRVRGLEVKSHIQVYFCCCLLCEELWTHRGGLFLLILYLCAWGFLKSYVMQLQKKDLITSWDGGASGEPRKHLLSPGALFNYPETSQTRIIIVPQQEPVRNMLGKNRTLIFLLRNLWMPVVNATSMDNFSPMQEIKEGMYRRLCKWLYHMENLGFMVIADVLCFFFFPQYASTWLISFCIYTCMSSNLAYAVATITSWLLHHFHQYQWHRTDVLLLQQ